MEQIIQKYSITNFFIQDLTITIIEGSQEIMSLLKKNDILIDEVCDYKILPKQFLV